MNNAIILLSGGLDSLVSLAVEKEKYKNILALTFDYGQKSVEKEINASSYISKYYGIKHQVVKLDWLAQISTSSLNTKEDIPNLGTSELNNIDASTKSAKSVWVPNRNALFINIAASFAEAEKYSCIIIGANKEEAKTFKDNTKEFVVAINFSLKHSTNSEVFVSAPLIDMTKEEIVKTGIEKDIPFELLSSCYKSSEKHCGTCESCNRLKRALELNNRYDIIKKIFQD